MLAKAQAAKNNLDISKVHAKLQRALARPLLPLNLDVVAEPIAMSLSKVRMDHDAAILTK